MYLCMLNPPGSSNSYQPLCREHAVFQPSSSGMHLPLKAGFAGRLWVTTHGVCKEICPRGVFVSVNVV